MQKGSKEKGHISNFNRSINLKEVTEGHLLKGKGVHIKQGKGHVLMQKTKTKGHLLQSKGVTCQSKRGT